MTTFAEACDRVDLVIAASRLRDVVPPRRSLVDGQTGSVMVELQCLSRWGKPRRGMVLRSWLTPPQARRVELFNRASKILEGVVVPIGLVTLAAAGSLLSLAQFGQMRDQLQLLSESLLGVGLLLVLGVNAARVIIPLRQHPRVVSGDEVLLRRVCRAAADELAALNEEDLVKVL